VKKNGQLRIRNVFTLDSEVRVGAVTFTPALGGKGKLPAISLSDLTPPGRAGRATGQAEIDPELDRAA